MIPDTETTLLRGGKMYEEGNEKRQGAQMGTKPQPQWKRPKRMKKEQKNRMMASQSR